MDGATRPKTLLQTYSRLPRSIQCSYVSKSLSADDSQYEDTNVDNCNCNNRANLCPYSRFYTIRVWVKAGDEVLQAAIEMYPL